MTQQSSYTYSNTIPDWLAQVSTPPQSIAAQLSDLLGVTAGMLGVRFSMVSRVENNELHILYHSPGAPNFGEDNRNLKHSFCVLTYERNQILVLDDIGQTVYRNHPCHTELGISTYIGIPLYVNGTRFGTLSFLDFEPRHAPFSDADDQLLRMTAQWVSNLLERKLVEEALRESELRMRSILDHTPALVARINSDYRLDFIHVPTVEPDRIARLVGINFMELVDDERRDMFQAVLAAVFEMGVESCFETIIDHPILGHNIWYQFNLAPVLADGEVQSLLLLATDISARRKMEAELKKRDAILEAVAYSAQKLLESPNWRIPIDDILARLGAAATASRIYIFENRKDPLTGDLRTSQRCEWTASGITEQIHNEVLQDLSIMENIPRWVEYMQKNQTISGFVRDFPESERSVLDPQNIISILAIPIFAGNEWWGFIGFDECEQEREWTRAEIDALRAAAGHLGAAIDRQRKESELHRLSGQLATLIHNMKSGILVEDESGFIILANQAFCDIFNLQQSPSELIGLTKAVIAQKLSLRDTDQAGYLASMQVLLHNQKAHYGDQFTLADDRILERDYVPIFIDNSFKGHLWQYHDVTERVKGERTLQESEERFRQLAETIDDVFWMIEPMTQKMIYVSPALERIWGLSVQDILAEPMSFINYIHEDDRERMMSAFIRQLDGGYDEIYRVNHPKNGIRWVHDRSFVIKNKSGEVYRIVGITRDITRQKQYEQRIQSQNETLRATNEELAVARRQADAANKLKSQFLATISHELRTPLNAIIGYAQLQLAGMVGEITEEQRGFQVRILYNAQHLLQLIDEVLDISRIEAGKLELKEQIFETTSLFVELEAQNKVLAEARNLALEFSIDESLPKVIIADRSRLKQIIINLISNAIKFTDQGTISVSASLAKPDQWCIQVRDTGTGISKEAQQIIFDEFRQAEEGFQRGGTGLGLAIVRKLVLAMGGSIHLRSELGKGSEFTIMLPLRTSDTLPFFGREPS